MTIYEVPECSDSLLQPILTIWETSVRATHHFLSNAEIAWIRDYVPQAVRAVEHLVLAEDAFGTPVAFLGAEGHRLEMLFLAPPERGKGIGRQLLQYGVQHYGIREVTVNEQNPQAVGFYEHLGFETYRRTDCDENGDPYSLVIWELRHEHKIGLLIEIADIPRSTYYYYSKQFDHPKPDRYAEIKTEIRRIYEESKGRYGYRRITKELKKKFVINHKTVQKLMRKMGIFCRVRMHKYHSYKGNVGRIAPNLLKRNFKADQPNQKWVTDVTEFALFGIKLYLSPIIDLYNGEVISYNLSRHPNLNQVTDMLEKAFSKIPDNTNLILHSDQGWQYQHKHYQKMLKEKGIRQSMSRKGNCLDNACAENFFSLLKTELLYLQEFHSVEHFIEELHEYIEWYNNKRIKLKLNGLSPIDFRQEAA